MHHTTNWSQLCKLSNCCNNIHKNRNVYNKTEKEVRCTTGKAGLSLNNLFLFTHKFISPYLHLFVTTRQSSTYKQSTMDSEVRKPDYIRTLVTQCDNKTHNNAPKATGNGLMQCGTAITRSNFLKFSQQTTHIPPVSVRNGVPIVCFKSELFSAADSVVLCVNSR